MANSKENIKDNAYESINRTNELVNRYYEMLMKNPDNLSVNDLALIEKKLILFITKLNKLVGFAKARFMSIHTDKQKRPSLQNIRNLVKILNKCVDCLKEVIQRKVSQFQNNSFGMIQEIDTSKECKQKCFYINLCRPRFRRRNLNQSMISHRPSAEWVVVFYHVITYVTNSLFRMQDSMSIFDEDMFETENRHYPIERYFDINTPTEFRRWDNNLNSFGKHSARGDKTTIADNALVGCRIKKFITLSNATMNFRKRFGEISVESNGLYFVKKFLDLVIDEIKTSFSDSDSRIDYFSSLYQYSHTILFDTKKHEGGIGIIDNNSFIFSIIRNDEPIGAIYLPKEIPNIENYTYSNGSNSNDDHVSEFGSGDIDICFGKTPECRFQQNYFDCGENKNPFVDDIENPSKLDRFLVFAIKKRDSYDRLFVKTWN
ncbi:hypothetical protein QTN25_008052 [Entamoeba marina]